MKQKKKLQGREDSFRDAHIGMISEAHLRHQAEKEKGLKGKKERC
jgi:hypothetical protein